MISRRDGDGWLCNEVGSGNAVLLGEAEDGDEADVPVDLIDLAQQLYGLHHLVC